MSSTQQIMAALGLTNLPDSVIKTVPAGVGGAASGYASAALAALLLGHIARRNPGKISPAMFGGISGGVGGVGGTIGAMQGWSLGKNIADQRNSSRNRWFGQ